MFPAGSSFLRIERAMPTEKLTVLVVDDEPMITTVLAAVLRRAGYLVLAATGPREAMEICRNVEPPIALAIVDYLMPEQNGADLAAQLKTIQPDMRVVMMSGYTGAEIKMAEVPCEVHGFLQKPFKVETAMDVVQKALN
jgi:DNA-binding NtrC family response regulator